MTNIYYTKEQIDGLAVYLAEAIRNYVTPLTEIEIATDTGDSETKLVSQKLLTDKLAEIFLSLNTLDAVSEEEFNTAITQITNTINNLEYVTLETFNTTNSSINTSISNIDTTPINTFNTAIEKLTLDLASIPSVEILNTTGNSTSAGVSQKLFTDTLGDISAILDQINGES